MLSKLAILIDPSEKYPPTNQKGFTIFTEVAKKLDIDIQFITKQDFDKLRTFDGLFIRTITSLTNYTYQWAEMCDYLGIKLIDTPKAISLGSNKHLQHALFSTSNIFIPKTNVIYAWIDPETFISDLKLPFPLVIKTPDGSFSHGVFKVNSKQEFINKCSELFFHKNYYSLLVQEFIYTSFDWRIGILNKKPIFCCKYYMAENHWQIIKYNNNEIVNEGKYECFFIKDIPQNILQCLNSIYNFLDDGLYGIDIKVHNDKAFLIEINDNPNLYADIEDQCEQTTIYQTILEKFVDT